MRIQSAQKRIELLYHNVNGDPLGQLPTDRRHRRVEGLVVLLGRATEKVDRVPSGYKEVLHTTRRNV